MIRMLGVLCGAAIAIGLLTWLVGVPQFTQERTSLPEPIVRVELPSASDTAVRKAAGTALETSDENPAETATGMVMESAMEAAMEPASGSTPELTDRAVAQAPAGKDTASARITADPAAASLVDEADTAAASRAGFEPFDPDTVPAPPAEMQDNPKWFAFWSPFRSELAANGFVTRLQSVTGLDYRVVRIKPGVYEVAFAYTDDDEIDAKLATISSATGLKLASAP